MSKYSASHLSKLVIYFFSIAGEPWEADLVDLCWPGWIELTLRSSWKWKKLSNLPLII